MLRSHQVVSEDDATDSMSLTSSLFNTNTNDNNGNRRRRSAAQNNNRNSGVSCHCLWPRKSHESAITWAITLNVRKSHRPFLVDCYCTCYRRGGASDWNDRVKLIIIYFSSKSFQISLNTAQGLLSTNLALQDSLGLAINEDGKLCIVINEKLMVMLWL